MPIEVVQGDITRMRADAIVNAANPALTGGGGVDGAIHRGAGPQLLAACLDLPEVHAGVRCPTGEARVTPAFKLPARYVIHTVGPIWHGGTHDEARLLEACYRNSLQQARALRLEQIIFPAISCGVYGYPHAQAARIAVDTVRDELARHAGRPSHVRLCCYGPALARVFQAALDDAAGASPA